MIPRVIHQLWFGPRPVPDWVDAWRDVGFEHVLWREADLPPLVNQRSFDYYAKRGIWHGAANVARVELLLAHGGFYVDVDSRPLRSFADAPFMGVGLVAGYEPNVPDLPGRVANGTIGAEPGHPALRTYRELIADMRVFEPSWDTTGGTAFTASLLVHRRCCSIHIVPPRVFYPRDAHGRTTPGLEDPWTDHFWASTHDLYAEAVA